MLDINNELENILRNNGIIQNTSLNNAIASVEKFRENLTDNDIIGIYGVGNDADTLLHFITGIVCDFHIDYCFDMNVRDYRFRDVIKNADVLSVADICKMSVNYMIIGSYQFRDELKKNLKEKNYAGTVVDFYELLEDYLREHTSDYKTIYETRKKYENSQGREQETTLAKLIKEYLLIKDFSSAFTYIDKYIECRYKNIEIYKRLKKELQGLLSNIKKQIRNRKCHDIVINWIDALSYIHLKDFPFLQFKAKNGINFENAYTVNPWTTETMKTLLYGEYSIENRLFLKEEFISEETKLLKMLNSEGYIFSYIGMNKYVKLYDNSTIRMPELNFRKDDSSVSRQWDALSLLCKEEKPLCLVIHTLRETHEPYICAEIEPYQKFTCTEADWNLEACRIQAEVSGRYIDRQFAFYDEFYGKNITKIYMSDHGRITNSIMKESRMHTVFIVDCPRLRNKTIKGIFSLIDFTEIIKNCLRNETDFTKLEKEYAQVEALDYYNLSWIKVALNDPKYNKLEALQRRGIITLKDRYCIFANGRECYFITGDEENDRINDKEYEERIEELRELCGKEFIDINQYEKFKYSRILYKA